MFLARLESELKTLFRKSTDRQSGRECISVPEKNPLYQLVQCSVWPERSGLALRNISIKSRSLSVHRS